MSEKIFKPIGTDVIDKIKVMSPFKVLAHDTVIAYEGQTPNFAVMVNRGTVSIENYETRDILKPILIFLEQVQNNKAADEQVSLHKGSEVSILDRALLKELQQLKIVL